MRRTISTCPPSKSSRPGRPTTRSHWPRRSARCGTPAAAALEALDSVRLIDVAPDAGSRPVQVVTTPTAEQRELLGQLRMTHLLAPPSA